MLDLHSVLLQASLLFTILACSSLLSLSADLGPVILAGHVHACHNVDSVVRLYRHHERYADNEVLANEIAIVY
jgi:hypothetical protein